MPYEIRYTDSRGRARIHNYAGHEAGAEGWARTLSRENGGRRAEAVFVSNGMYPDINGPEGTERHLITVGDDGPTKR
jgi:hypothetical protein